MIPEWSSASLATWSIASEADRAIVFHFVKPGEMVQKDRPELGERYRRAFRGDGMLEFSQKKAIFIPVFAAEEAKEEDNSTGHKTVGAEAFPDEIGVVEVKKDENIPLSPLASEDFFKSLNASVGDTVVTDWFGNNPKKFTSVPSLKKLEGAVKPLASGVEKYTKKIDKKFKNVAELMESEGEVNKGELISEAIKVMKLGIRGPASMEKAIEIYTDTIEEARVDIYGLVAKKDLEGLEKMAKEFKRTVIEDEAEEAIKKVKAASKVDGTAEAKK